MARYIDADVLKERLERCKATTDDLFGMGVTRGVERAETTIDMMSTADVVEVKHGEWIPYESEEPFGDESETTWHKCSICGTDAVGRCYDDEWYSYPLKTNYCPNCGAKMDGERRDT